MRFRFIDEFEHGHGWAPEEERLMRTSHAVAVDGRVWVTDPLDGEGIEERIRALGEPAAVIQLLDRHGRESAAVAERLGVPLRVVPFDGVQDAPFEVIPIVQRKRWREVALWFPAERILVCADALGSLPYFRGRGEPFGVHPLLRFFPPKRALGGLEPRHILFGHGESYHGEDAGAALADALSTARRRLPFALWSFFRAG